MEKRELKASVEDKLIARSSTKGSSESMPLAGMNLPIGVRSTVSTNGNSNSSIGETISVSVFVDTDLEQVVWDRQWLGQGESRWHIGGRRLTRNRGWTSGGDGDRRLAGRARERSNLAYKVVLEPISPQELRHYSYPSEMGGLGVGGLVPGDRWQM